MRVDVSNSEPSTAGLLVGGIVEAHDWHQSRKLQSLSLKKESCRSAVVVFTWSVTLTRGWLGARQQLHETPQTPLKVVPGLISELARGVLQTLGKIPLEPL